MRKVFQNHAAKQQPLHLAFNSQIHHVRCVLFCMFFRYGGGERSQSAHLEHENMHYALLN